MPDPRPHLWQVTYSDTRCVHCGIVQVAETIDTPCHGPLGERLSVPDCEARIGDPHGPAAQAEREKLERELTERFGLEKPLFAVSFPPSDVVPITREGIEAMPDFREQLMNVYKSELDRIVGEATSSLRVERDGLLAQLAESRDEAAALRKEVERLRSEDVRIPQAIAREHHEIDQILGRALGYGPAYPLSSDVDDGTIETGSHTAATLADEAARRIGDLKREVEQLREAIRKLILAEPKLRTCPEVEPSAPAPIPGDVSTAEIASSLQDRLFFDRNISVFSPCIKGTWITVSYVISLISDGCTWFEIKRAHPELTDDDIRACLDYTIARESEDESVVERYSDSDDISE